MADHVELSFGICSSISSVFVTGFPVLQSEEKHHLQELVMI